ncbi:hypothetical protein BKA64DRAFT_728436 [Cadophora sp. MPI-SDFR-AT-0126]|nr:hypothetical protein BKA64DRAFT_728436 [Leotiomycetes sp. MPI-SDFR-AT-0126]
MDSSAENSKETSKRASLSSLPLPASQANASKYAAYLKAMVSKDHSDIPMILCCLVSGLCDSSSYNAWSCFVSMQTGNTIFLALGAANLPVGHPYGWAKSLISIVAFNLGCKLFATVFKTLDRRHLSLSFAFQATCIFIAAILVQTNVVPPARVDSAGHIADVNFLELIPLIFLAFQSGGQIVTSRLLGLNEIPTTVLTSVYCDLVSDPNILKKDNVKRDRRAGSVVFLLVGGLAGGWISRTAGLSVVFWIAGGIKAVLAVAWLFWKENETLA